MSRDLYEFAATHTEVPWDKAVANGWLNCPDAGGWLRMLPPSVVIIEDKEKFVKALQEWGMPKQRAYLIWREFTGG